MEILEYYTDRTPGSFIEEKQLSIVWHYGNADSTFGQWQAAECQNHIEQSLSALSIHATRKRTSLEVAPRNINKGVFAKRVLEYHRYVGGTTSTNRLKKRSSVVSSSGATTTRPPKTRAISIDSNEPLDPITFFLVVGDDRSDEFMFEAVDKIVGGGEGSTTPLEAKGLFTCTVGRKSSAAHWFLPGVSDVLGMLGDLGGAVCDVDYDSE